MDIQLLRAVRFLVKINKSEEQRQPIPRVDSQNTLNRIIEKWDEYRQRVTGCISAFSVARIVIILLDYTITDENVFCRDSVKRAFYFFLLFVPQNFVYFVVCRKKFNEFDDSSKMWKEFKLLFGITIAITSIGVLSRVVFSIAGIPAHISLAFEQIMGVAIRVSSLFILIALPLKWQYESDIAQAKYRMADAPYSYKKINEFLQESPENTESFKNFLRRSFQLNNFEFWESVDEFQIYAHNLPQSAVVEKITEIFNLYIAPDAPLRLNILSPRSLLRRTAYFCDFLKKPSSAATDVHLCITKLVTTADEVLKCLEEGPYFHFRAASDPELLWKQPWKDRRSAVPLRILEQRRLYGLRERHI
eukprot:113557_1